MQIEGVPEGWEVVRYGIPEPGDCWLQGVQVCQGDNYPNIQRLIVRKIERPKKYRPFANAAEFAPHRDRWARLKDEGDVLMRIACYTEADATLTTFVNPKTFSECLDLFVFDDGSPFGIEVSE